MASQREISQPGTAAQLRVFDWLDWPVEPPTIDLSENSEPLANLQLRDRRFQVASRSACHWLPAH